MVEGWKEGRKEEEFICYLLPGSCFALSQLLMLLGCLLWAVSKEVGVVGPDLCVGATLDLTAIGAIEATLNSGPYAHFSSKQH